MHSIVMTVMIREDSREIVLGKKVNIFKKIKGKGKNFWGSEIKQGGPGFLKWIFLLIYFLAWYLQHFTSL